MVSCEKIAIPCSAPRTSEPILCKKESLFTNTVRHRQDRWQLKYFWNFHPEPGGNNHPILEISGQILATSHDLTTNGGLVREFPLFQGNLGWWNIIIWPEICFRWVVQPPTRKGIGAQTTTGLKDLSFCHGWRDPKRVVLVYLFPCFFDDQVAEQSNAYHLLKGNEGRKGKVVQIVVENCLQWTRGKKYAEAASCCDSTNFCMRRSKVNAIWNHQHSEKQWIQMSLECHYPSLPNTSWEGVLGMFLGSKYLLTRCLEA